MGLPGWDRRVFTEGFVSACFCWDYGSNEKRRGGPAGTRLKVWSENETNASQVATKLSILGCFRGLSRSTVRADHFNASRLPWHHLPIVSLANGNLLE